MKKLFKRIDWKKFWKYELISFLVIGLLYFSSLMRGDNVYPENAYVLYVIPLLFAFLMLLRAHLYMREEKIVKKREN